MKRPSKGQNILILFLWILCLAPFCYIAVRSIADPDSGLTLQYYYEVFFATPQYLYRFWKSLFLGGSIAVGQMIVSVLAGYAFAKISFPGKNAIFSGLIIFMIMPVQVALIANYLIIGQIGLLDTYLSLILPAIFVPLGTFIMTHSFRAIPDEVIEAAKLDGCSLFQMIARIGVPMSRSGLVCTMLLSFLDAWNMVEQPIVYLKEFAKYPISVALASSPIEEPTAQMVCCILVAIPPLLLFALFNKEMVEGIASVKET